jgi:hypothetical protein
MFQRGMNDMRWTRSPSYSVDFEKPPAKLSVFDRYFTE